MPVYNGSRYLQRSIGSLTAQTYTDWELVALDDESTDDSLSVLKQLAAADKRIKIMSKLNDGKGNTARNISLMSKEAEGDYIFYMSQDDYLSADLLQNAVSRAEETGAEIVIPDMLLANADGSTEQAKGSFAPDGDYSTLLSGEENSRIYYTITTVLFIITVKDFFIFAGKRNSHIVVFIWDCREIADSQNSFFRFLCLSHECDHILLILHQLNPFKSIIFIIQLIKCRMSKIHIIDKIQISCLQKSLF